MQRFAHGHSQLILSWRNHVAQTRQRGASHTSGWTSEACLRTCALAEKTRPTGATKTSPAPVQTVPDLPVVPQQSLGDAPSDSQVDETSASSLQNLSLGDAPSDSRVDKTSASSLRNVSRPETLQSKDNLTAAIRNPGNTCYLNSLLHVFARVPAFCHWFEQHLEKDGVLHNRSSCALCHIAKDIKKIRIGVQDDEPFVPKIVQRRGSWSGGLFRNARQQDVTEAIAVLLDSLNSIDKKAAMIENKDPFATPMWRALQITQTSRLHCHRCQYAKDKEERLTTLSVEVPQTSQHIEDLINNPFGGQPLQSQDDRYECPAEQPCPSHAHVTRSVQPGTWPPVLIIALKLWTPYEIQGVHHIRKNSTSVDFEVLLRVPEADAPDHLRGVIQHHGAEAYGGHYTSYVRASDNFWYHCDDNRSPQRVPVEQMLAAEAYVLIYES